MNLGYDEKLYILAFDHRGSFQKRFFGIEGEPDAEQTAIIADAKHLIFEGLLQAVGAGADPAVDRRARGRAVRLDRARRRRASSGLKLAMPAERSGQPYFDFQYGEDFPAHIERFDPDFTKVLVRYNPDGDGEANRDQREKLRRLSDWLHANEPQVPVRAAGARRGRAAAGGRRRQRPLRRRAAPRADAPRDRGAAGRGHRGRHLEDRGRGRALGLRDARRAGAHGRPRRRHLRGARPRRRRRQGRPLARRRPRPWRASSASRSGARSGGTR